MSNSFILATAVVVLLASGSSAFSTVAKIRLFPQHVHDSAERAQFVDGMDYDHIFYGMSDAMPQHPVKQVAPPTTAYNYYKQHSFGENNEADDDYAPTIHHQKSAGESQHQQQRFYREPEDDFFYYYS